MPFYVGKGSKNRAYQFNNHSKWCKSIIEKEGKETIKIEVIECKNEQEAFKLETRWILTFKSDGYTLCNLTDGGEGCSGYKHTKEARQKISQTNTGDPRLIAAGKGKARCLGYKHTEEARKNMSNAQKGKHAGVIITEEQRQKISLANKGEGNGRAKLTLEEVKEIRYKYNTLNITKPKLAIEYKMSLCNIQKIITNQIWIE